MHSEIRRVGNSKGIIFPKAILEQCHFEETVDMQVIDGGLLIKPVYERRAGWEEAFRHAKLEQDETTQDWLSLSNDFDDAEWVW